MLSNAEAQTCRSMRPQVPQVAKYGCATYAASPFLAEGGCSLVALPVKIGQAKDAPARIRYKLRLAQPNGEPGVPIPRN